MTKTAICPVCGKKVLIDDPGGSFPGVEGLDFFIHCGKGWLVDKKGVPFVGKKEES